MASWMLASACDAPRVLTDVALAPLVHVLMRRRVDFQNHLDEQRRNLERLQVSVRPSSAVARPAALLEDGGGCVGDPEGRHFWGDEARDIPDCVSVTSAGDTWSYPVGRGGGLAALASTPCQGVPQSLEDALAPLLLLHGKPFAAAVNIVINATEPIFRYRCGRHYGGPSPLTSPRPTPAGPSRSQPTSAPPQRPTRRYHGREVYQVGEYRLLSCYYCPCRAFHYQVLKHREVSSCKHLLALQMALRFEASGMPEYLRDREVSEEELIEMLSHP